MKLNFLMVQKSKHKSSRFVLFYLEAKRKAFFNPFSRHPFYLFFF